MTKANEILVTSAEAEALARAYANYRMAEAEAAPEWMADAARTLCDLEIATGVEIVPVSTLADLADGLVRC